MYLRKILRLKPETGNVRLLCSRGYRGILEERFVELDADRVHSLFREGQLVSAEPSANSAMSHFLETRNHDTAHRARIEIVNITADIAVAIVGGGAVGQAIGYQLGLAGVEAVVVEACRHDSLENQSTRNSGVIHAGLYYQQESQPWKARLCVRGNELLYKFCLDHEVPHFRTGKIVVATDERESGYLDPLLQIALQNGVPGAECIGEAQCQELEPNVRAISALYLPSSGIVDSAAYLRTLHKESASHTLWASRVTAVKKVASGFAISTRCEGKESQFVAKKVVNAAGLFSDDIAKMVNPASPHRIMAVRGESAKFYHHRRNDLTMNGLNVYPVPCGFYRKTGKRALLSYSDYSEALASGQITATTGVHLTPTMGAEGEIATTVRIGPAITTGLGKENMVDALHGPRYYHSQVNHFFPNLSSSDIEIDQCGIQARLAGKRDWILERDPGEADFINLIGVDSPGLTASLAIGEELLAWLL